MSKTNNLVVTKRFAKNRICGRIKIKKSKPSFSWQSLGLDQII